VLAAPAKVSPAAATAGAFPALKAGLAVHGPIAAGLKWNRGLLPASGANYGCTL